MCKKYIALMILTCCVGIECCAIEVLGDEPPIVYELSRVIVESDKYKTPDQKFVLTGGNVSVISRSEIERRHFSDIKEALATVSGISIEDPGYRAQAYQENGYASQTIRVNGDSRVLILVDGKRMDVGINSAAGSTRGRTNISMLTGIDNVERIEIVKGQGALAYGSDATNVINIITRKGMINPQGKISVAAGSWGKRNYKLTHSGMLGQWKYYAGIAQEKSGDTKYRDAFLNKVVTFKNSKFNDKSAFLSLSREIDHNHEIAFSYSHQSTKDHFPIAAPDYEHPYIKGYSNLASWYPGYRNMFIGDQKEGVYTTTLMNDIDMTYTFLKDHEIPSFIRLYKLHHYYYEMDGFGWTPTDIEDGVGGEIQYGRLLRGKDILLAGAEIKRNKYYYNEGAQEEGQDPSTYYQMWSRRTDKSVYLQDKIKISKKWILTPGIRYSYYGNIKRKDTENNHNTYKSFSRVTAGLFTNYSPNDKMDIYASWSQLFNPPFSSDMRKNKDIRPERGNLYTLGLKYKITNRTKIGVSYNHSSISDAILRYSYINPNYDPATMKPRYKWLTRCSNVDQTKDSFSIELYHDFSSAWEGTLSYVHFSTHQDVPANNEYNTDDQVYQHWYPQNMFKMSISYHRGKWDAALYGTLYAGADKKRFSDNKFLLWDAHVNYHINKNGTIYLKVMNISDIAYETRASAWGIGAFPQPSRRFTVGYEYNF